MNQEAACKWHMQVFALI